LKPENILLDDNGELMFFFIIVCSLIVIISVHVFAVVMVKKLFILAHLQMNMSASISSHYSDCNNLTL